MEKFTFITEYKKGTYIRQIMSTTLDLAIAIWIEYVLSNSNLLGMNEQESLIYASEMRKDFNAPSVVNDVDNVWCIYLKIGRYTFLTNIVITK